MRQPPSSSCLITEKFLYLEEPTESSNNLTGTPARAFWTSANTPRSFSHVASAAQASAYNQPRQTQSLKRSHQLSSRRACACASLRKRRSRRRACPSSFCFSLFFFLRAISVSNASHACAHIIADHFVRFCV